MRAIAPRRGSAPRAIAWGDSPRHVYDRLRRLIVRRRLVPGDRIVEVDIARQLGVGRTPVREALQRLLQEGYVVPGPTRRTQLSVAPLSADDLDELYEIVGSLEGRAARRAARLPPERRRALSDALRRANAAFASAGRASPVDLDVLFTRHRRFHQCFAEAAAGPRLRALLRLVRQQVERYEWLYGHLFERRLAVSVVEHERIIRAVARGDADAAQRAAEANWRNAATRLGAMIAAGAQGCKR